MRAIYKPGGRAAEYAPLAVNLFTGCGHACDYCWTPQVLRMEPAEFFQNPQPRPGILTSLAQSARRIKNAPQPVLLCFTCDPYQPCEEQHRLTRSALEILLAQGLTVSILSKGGLRATQDLDLLAASDRPHAFGASLTALSPELSARWEPQAAPPAERLAALRQARYPNSRYASLEQCRMELGAAETFFKRHALPIVDTTRMSVEEIAARLRQS